MSPSKTKNFLAEDTRGLTSAHRGSRNETTRLEHLADTWALLSRMSLCARASWRGNLSWPVNVHRPAQERRSPDAHSATCARKPPHDEVHCSHDRLRRIRRRLRMHGHPILPTRTPPRQPSTGHPVSLLLIASTRTDAWRLRGARATRRLEPATCGECSSAEKRAGAAMRGGRGARGRGGVRAAVLVLPHAKRVVLAPPPGTSTSLQHTHTDVPTPTNKALENRHPLARRLPLHKRSQQASQQQVHDIALSSPPFLAPPALLAGRCPHAARCSAARSRAAATTVAVAVAVAVAIPPVTLALALVARPLVLVA